MPSCAKNDIQSPTLITKGAGVPNNPQAHPPLPLPVQYKIRKAPHEVSQHDLPGDTARGGPVLLTRGTAYASAGCEATNWHKCLTESPPPAHACGSKGSTGQPARLDSNVLNRLPTLSVWISHLTMPLFPSQTAYTTATPCMSIATEMCYRQIDWHNILIWTERIHWGTKEMHLARASSRDVTVTLTSITAMLLLLLLLCGRCVLMKAHESS